MTVEMTLGQVCLGTKKYTCRYTPHSPNFRMHWAVKNRWSKAWQEAVFWAFKSAKHGWKAPDTMVKVVITLLVVSPMDPDNAVASTKALIDGLRYAGAIKNDTREHIALHVEQIKVAKKTEQGVRITLTQA